jgi:hypothetical protein
MIPGTGVLPGPKKGAPPETCSTPWDGRMREMYFLRNLQHRRVEHMSKSSSDTATPPVTVVQAGKEKNDNHCPEVEYRSRPRVIKPDPRESNANKMTRLVKYLAGIQNQKFTGYIKVNFTQGSIGRIERFEEILSK